MTEIVSQALPNEAEKEKNQVNKTTPPEKEKIKLRSKKELILQAQET